MRECSGSWQCAEAISNGQLAGDAHSQHACCASHHGQSALEHWIASQSNLCTAAEKDVVCKKQTAGESISCTYPGVSAAQLAATFANERVLFVGDSAGRGLLFKMTIALTWAELHLEALAGADKAAGTHSVAEAVELLRKELMPRALCNSHLSSYGPEHTSPGSNSSDLLESLGRLQSHSSFGFVHLRAPRLNSTLSKWTGPSNLSPLSPLNMHFSGAGFFHPEQLIRAASQAEFKPTLVYGQATNWFLHLFPKLSWKLPNGANAWRAYETTHTAYLRHTRQAFGNSVHVWSTANALCQEKMYNSKDFLDIALWWRTYAGQNTSSERAEAHAPLDACLSSMSANISKGDAVRTCVDSSFTQHGVARMNERAMATLKHDEHRHVRHLDTPLLTHNPLGRSTCNLTEDGDGRHYPALDVLKIRVLMSIVEGWRGLAAAGIPSMPVQKRESEVGSMAAPAQGDPKEGTGMRDHSQHVPRQHPPSSASPPAPSRLPHDAHHKHISWQRCPTSEMRALRNDYLHDGMVIARGFLDESTINGLQLDLEDTVRDAMSRVLSRQEQRAIIRQELDFDHMYTAVYEANVNSASNSGQRSDLPAYFRSETHTAAIHKFLTHVRLLELVRCLLPGLKEDLDTQFPLKLYPVYMARGKVPDRVSKSAMTVDWHQDAEYTYYWYSALNTTIEQIEEYAASVVNTWVPITDTPRELGPVELLRRRPVSLTRAEFRCEGNDCAADGRQGSQRREYLRIAEIDQYIEAFPERVVTAEMKRGDVLFFDQFTYHRGLPNISPNRTRWSVDFRFQDARVPTLRPHPGFVLGSDKLAVDAAAEFNAPLITNDMDWQHVDAAQRISQTQTSDATGTLTGHAFAERHEYATDLLGALHLERQRCRRSACRVAELEGS